MRFTIDETLLDDPEWLGTADSTGALRAIATSGAQVRQAARQAQEAGLRRLAEDGVPPRMLVVTGVGTAAFPGEVLSSWTWATSSVPVAAYSDEIVPAHLGALDVLVLVSASGTSESLVDAVRQAARRGCELVTVVPSHTPVADATRQARGIHIPVDVADRAPVDLLWSMLVPVLLVADALGIVQLPATVIEATADLLDEVSVQCRPASESFVNPAKTLAVDLAQGLPVVWGCGGQSGLAASRFARRLVALAGFPALYGALPGVAYQGMLFDRAFGRPAGEPSQDFFRDRAEEEEVMRPKVVLLRDDEAEPRATWWAEHVYAAADRAAVTVREVTAEGTSPLERLASLVALTDFATVYLALALGVDLSAPGPLPTVDL